ncbi:MAG: amino acid permease [Candidatus Poseidoniaceae archaeon]
MNLKQTASKLVKGDVKGVIEDVADTLERSVGLSGVVIIAIASMVGSGLFVMPSFAADIMGPGIWMAFLLSALVVFPGAISKSELASAMPSSGGSYVFLERTYGPLFGTVSGLGLWASFLLKAAFALIGFSAYMYALTEYFDVEVNMQILSIVTLALITFLNILGVKKIKAVQTPILGVTMALLLLVCILALFDGNADFSRPLTTKGGSFGEQSFKVAEAAAFVFVAYAGVIKVAAIGGEIKDPGRNLPLGILISLGLVTFLYCAVTFIMFAAVPEEAYQVDGKPVENPVFVFVDYVAGTKIGLLAAFLAVLTMASGALSGILAASRFVFAMARDNLLPQALETVNAKYETPHWPILLTGFAMLLAILFLPVKDVAKLASGFQIMVFVAVNSSVIVLRRSPQAQEWYKPDYKSPLYPFVQIFGIISGVALVYLMGEKALIGAAGAGALGAITYIGYGRKHNQVITTPFKNLREQFSNPTKAEHDLRLAAFKAADLGLKNHLTLPEFINALKALGVSYTNDEFRTVFHKADTDENGVLDIDEFMILIETIDDGPTKSEAE